MKSNRRLGRPSNYYSVLVRLKMLNICYRIAYQGVELSVDQRKSLRYSWERVFSGMLVSHGISNAILQVGEPIFILWQFLFVHTLRDASFSPKVFFLKTRLQGKSETGFRFAPNAIKNMIPIDSPCLTACTKCSFVIFCHQWDNGNSTNFHLWFSKFDDPFCACECVKSQAANSSLVVCPA